MPIKYDVAAWFSPPVAEKRVSSTRDQGEESVFAETTEGAARIWYWRLSAAERTHTVRVVVFPPKPNPIIQTYKGPVIRYAKRDGKLVEIAG